MKLGIVGVGGALLAYILGQVAAELAGRACYACIARFARKAQVTRARRRVAGARRRRGVGAARDAGGRVVGGLLRVDSASGARGTIGLVKQGVEGADRARGARALDCRNEHKRIRIPYEDHTASLFGIIIGANIC